MSYEEYHPSVHRDELIIMQTCEELIDHLKNVDPKRTLTARKIIRKAMMEEAYG